MGGCDGPALGHRPSPVVRGVETHLSRTIGMGEAAVSQRKEGKCVSARRRGRRDAGKIQVHHITRADLTWEW